MDKSFDFDALLKQHARKHKSKPAQFSSVAGGVQNRLEKNIKLRKSNRLTVFDNFRNLIKCDSPVQKTVNNPASQKLEHRKQQLEKWKVEKEQKKKEEAKNRKKPFVAGKAHTPLRYVPPPPPPRQGKIMPSTSGRVTRSQSANNMKVTNVQAKQSTSNKNCPKPKPESSFAPTNAQFRPPQIKNMAKLPKLAQVPKEPRRNNTTISFEPLLPKDQKSVVNKTMSSITEKTSKPVPKSSVETRRTTRSRAIADLKSKSEILLPQKPQLGKEFVEASTSTSEIETNSIKRNTGLKSLRRSMQQVKNPVQSKSKEKLRNSKTDTVTSSSDMERKSSTEQSPVFAVKTPRRSDLSSKTATPKNPVPKSESSSEERLRSPKNVTTPLTPEQIVEESKNISPCVTMSRGKSNARKEMKKKIEDGLLDLDASCDSVEHFRRQLAAETARISNLCDLWDEVLVNTCLPDHVQEAVLSAVGQARLLLAQKFQQFAGLVDRCERPDPAAPLIHPRDLMGFWDMLFLQVVNVDMRFKSLEEVRARGWLEARAQPAPPPRAARRPPAPRAASRIRDAIAAARKAMKQPQPPQPPQQAQQEDKTFEAGFFCVRSPVRSPASPRARTLLKTVLSSEANKASATKKSASMAMLRASMISKNVDCESEPSSPYRSANQTPMNLSTINLDATPARSILKSTNKQSAKSGKKSIKLVLFNDSDTEQNTSNNNLNVTSNKVPDITLTEVQNIDSGMSSMEQENDHKLIRRRSKLARQDAMDDRSPVLTRSRRKSMQNTPKCDVEVLTPRRGSKKVLEEVKDNFIMENNENVTPKRSSRRRKSSATVV